MNKEERINRLDELGVKESDVMEDDKGEYVLVEPDLMDEGENESGKYRKVYLE